MQSAKAFLSSKIHDIF